MKCGTCGREMTYGRSMTPEKIKEVEERAAKGEKFECGGCSGAAKRFCDALDSVFRQASELGIKI